MNKPSLLDSHTCVPSHSGNGVLCCARGAVLYRYASTPEPLQRANAHRFLPMLTSNLETTHAAAKRPRIDENMTIGFRKPARNG